MPGHKALHPEGHPIGIAAFPTQQQEQHRFLMFSPGFIPVLSGWGWSGSIEQDHLSLLLCSVQNLRG